MSLLNIGYGLGGFMKGLNEQQNQQLLQQLSRLDLQRVQQQIQQQQYENQTAPLLFNYYLNQQEGGGQLGQPSVPQFGGGPFGGGTGAPTPPAATQPSSPPSPTQLGSGPTYGGIGDYGGGSPPGMGDYYAPAPGSGDGGAPSPLSGPRVSASRYGGMAVDPSFGPKLARDPVPQDPGDRFGPPGLGPLTPDASQGSPKFPGGSGQYTYDSSGNLIDQVTGSPVSSASSRAATPTTDIPPAATAPSSPPGFSGSSTSPDVISGPSPNLGGVDVGTTGYGSPPMRRMFPRGGMDRVLNLIEQDESGGRNIPNYRYDARHTAQGNFQITNTTWRETAPRAGVDINQYPTAMSAPYPVQRAVAARLMQERGTQPWADFNPKLAADLGGGRSGGSGGGGGVGSGGGGGANDAILQQAMGLIQKGMAPVPESMFGNMTAHQMAVQIEKANPNADPVVKMLALERGMKMMAPEERLKTEMYMQQHQDEFRLGLAILQSKLSEQRAADKPGEVVQLPGGGVGRVTGNTIVPLKIQGQEDQPTTGVTRLPTGGGARSGAGTNVTVTDDQGKVVYDGAAIPKAGGGYTQPDGTPLPKGTVKLMGKGKEDAGEPKPEQGTVDMIKSYTRAGLTVPYSFRTGKQGQANFQEALKELNQEGFTGADVALAQGDVKALDSAYRQMQALTSKVTSYSNLAKQNITAAAEQLKGTAPTDFGPLVNRFLVQGELMLGDPDVVGTNALVFASANELAKVLGGSTGAAAATDSSRREAMEILSPYFSSGQFAEAAKIANAEIDRRISGMNNELNSLRNRLKTGAGPAPGGPERKGTPGATPASGLPSTSTTAAPGEYKTADDVLKAIDSGLITVEEGKKILVRDFGYQQQQQ